MLEDESGKVLLRCAIANGFRNIQTIVRKMKMRRCEYHYVEVGLSLMIERKKSREMLLRMQ